MASGYVSTSSDRLPVVPLRDMVVFPQMMAPFIVGRRGSVLALEQTLRTAGKLIFLVAQRDPKVDDPGIDDIHRIGVVARVVQNVKLPNGNVKVMVEGLRRAELRTLEEIDDAFEAEVEVYEIDYPADDKVQVYMSRLLNSFEQYAKMSHHLAFESLMSTLKLDDPDRFADALAAHLTVSTAEKQTLLETLNPYERLQAVHDLLDVEVEKINIDKRINVQVKKQMEKAQKEYYLNEKIKAIHHELGRKDERGDEIAELKEKIEKSGAPKLVREKAEQELRRLEAMPPVSAEATVSRNYVDWLVSVPWKKKSRELKDLQKAARILDEGHYGLEKVKERVLEFLAVRQLTHKNQNSIICFVGPPGVGKSSLAKSIAAATGRKFVRLSLGGVRDEAEIRGHRRTYIGAFPGQIIQMMKRAGTVNPVFLLDEVDKMSMDFRGDPSSALLEVLDPEQNDTFVDHYMDIEYDLSRVMFIATANVEHPIPPALKDRMEIIQLAGYTPNEKLEIARQFLVPRQLDSHGLTADAVRFGEDSLGHLMDSYTREAGVRNLEREIAAVCRKLARRLVEEGRTKKLKARAKAKGGSEGQERRECDRGRPGTGRGTPRQAEVPALQEARRVRGRRRHRSGLDPGGRRAAAERSRPDEGQRQADPHRQAGRRDEGVGASRDVLPAQPRRRIRPGARLPRRPGPPHSCSRGRHSQGRAVGGHHDGVGDHLFPAAGTGTRRRGDDRRDHAARKGAARRRYQGQGAGRLPRGDLRDPAAEGERQGPRGSARGSPRQDEVPPRGVDGRGPGDRLRRSRAESAGGRGRVSEARLRGAAGERRPLKRPTQEVERDLEGP